MCTGDGWENRIGKKRETRQQSEKWRGYELDYKEARKTKNKQERRHEERERRINEMEREKKIQHNHREEREGGDKLGIIKGKWRNEW